MPDTPPLLSVILPAYNEEQRLPQAIRDIQSFFSKSNKTMAGATSSIEWLIVIEKSTDATVSVTHKAVGGDTQFRIIENSVHRGKGYAVKTGVQAARGAFIFFTDVDLSTPLSEILHFLGEFQAHPERDILIGDRQHPRSRIVMRQSFVRQSLGRTFNLLVRLLTQLPFSDTQCGFKGFRSTAAKRIFSELQTDHFAFDVEVILRAQRYGFSVHNLPVRWVNDTNSKVNILRDSKRMLWDILKIRFQLAVWPTPFLWSYRLLGVWLFVIWAAYRRDWRRFSPIKRSTLTSQEGSPLHKGADLWVHAASGEFEYAKPLLRHYKKQHPKNTVLVTYFSYSYRKVVENTPTVDISCSLPLDIAPLVKRFLQRTKPSALYIARTDLWPELLYQCFKAGIPVHVFSFVCTPEKKQKQGWLLRRILPWITSVHCIHEEDAQQAHLLQNKKQCPQVCVSGDTRIEEVFYKLKHPQALRVALYPQKPVLILGSTWETDECILVPLAKKMCQNFDVIWVPHEPDLKSLTRLEACFDAAPATRYSNISEWRGESVLLVDQVGLLAGLYKEAQVAFVGGSLGGRGVHSVLEPLACGVWTLVGPRFSNHREACIYSQKKVVQGATMVQPFCNGPEFLDYLQLYLEQSQAFYRCGQEVVTALQGQQGASAKILTGVEGFS